MYINIYTDLYINYTSNMCVCVCVYIYIYICVCVCVCVN